MICLHYNGIHKPREVLYANKNFSATPDMNKKPRPCTPLFSKLTERMFMAIGKHFTFAAWYGRAVVTLLTTFERSEPMDRVPWDPKRTAQKPQRTS